MDFNLINLMRFFPIQNSCSVCVISNGKFCEVHFQSVIFKSTRNNKTRLPDFSAMAVCNCHVTNWDSQLNNGHERWKCENFDCQTWTLLE